MSDASALLFAVLLLAANAFFVGAEFALISARRTAIEPRAAAGSRAARTTLTAMENVSVMMAGAQLGITLASLGLGALGEPAVAHLIEGPLHAAGVPDQLLHPIAFAIALSIVVYLHVVLGEMVPKNIALAGPDRAAVILGPPLVLVVRLLKPAVIGLNAIANLNLRLIGVTPRNEVTSAFTRDEVAGLVEESHREGLLDDEERDLLAGVLGFDERSTSAVLLPAERVVTISTSTTPREVEMTAARTGYSRFPVQEPGGALIGYVHLKDVLSTDPATRDAPIQPRRLRPLVTVTTTDKLRAVLARMQDSGAHLAQVTDAAGAHLGLVTLEDVLTEIIGEIRESRPAT